MNQMLEKELAAPEAADQAATGDVQQYLTFRLQNEMYGLDISPIKEIIEYGKLTTVPLAPSFVRGVINLRGNVVPVVDLPMRFGWDSSPVTKRSCIVIIEINHEPESLAFGMVVDAISEVLDLPVADIERAPTFGAKIRTDFIAGMGKVNEEFIVLLNASMVLSVDELSLLDQVADEV